MAHRKPLRTPEGAWYHNYHGYPPKVCNHPTLSQQEDQRKERELYPNGARINHDRKEAAELAGGPQTVRQLREVEMSEYEKTRGLDGMPPLVERQEIQAEVDRRRMENRHISPRGNEYIGVSGIAAARGNESTAFYNPYVDGPARRCEWELEWEPPEQFSPRKTTTDPSWVQKQQQPPGSPKKLPPWERDRDLDRESPRMFVGQGQHLDGYGQGQQLDGYGQGQTIAGGFDPRLARADVPKSLVQHGSGGAFLFVRFPLARGENVHVTAKACIQAKTSDLGGRFVGIARRVYDYGYPPGNDEGCAVFQFPSLKQAEVFFRCDKRIRQPDFPPPQGSAEIFAINLLCDPNTIQTYDTFLLSEITLNDGLSEANVQYYVDQYVDQCTRLMEEPQFKALPYAAFSKNPDDRKSMRRHFFGPRTIIALHMFQRPENLEELMQDKRYSTLRSIHNALATEKCSIFTIDRRACP
ncbi:uncharacterized protein [Littorina saxatilis]|uniref:Uncharacterized protein n=1 Tax=Littorina saxatilis TaxID=31220 RepID=A0AAN9BZE4_9CAEN